MIINVSGKAQWVLVFTSGLFLGIVLYIYQAFGIEQGVSFSGHSLLSRVVLFAFTTSGFFAINEFLIRPLLPVNRISRLVLWNAWEVFSAGSATHLLFNYFWNFTESTWGSYFLLQGEFASVMIVPLALFYLINQQRFEQDTMLHFISENGKEQVSVQSDRLLYVKAEDNYIRIVFLAKNGENGKVLRGKLSEVESLHRQLMRVHRSYLVNPVAIQHVERKPKQITIHFDHSSVPVSNSYADAFEDRIIRHSGAKSTTKS